MHKEVDASRALARSWESGSGGLGSETDVLNKELIRKLMLPRPSPDPGNLDLGGLGPQTDVLNKEFKRKLMLLGPWPDSWEWVPLLTWHPSCTTHPICPAGHKPLTSSL